MKKRLIIIFTLISLTTYGQSIKDFFLPKEGMNKSNYFSPDPKSGQNTGLETAIWFIKKSETFDVMEAKLTDGQATSIVTQTISISNSDIKQLKTVTTNLFEKNKQRNYSPPQTILKLPNLGQKLTWTYTSTAGESIKCTGELIDLKIKGETKRVIKVKKETLENGKVVEWATSIEYYVQGVGLFKKETLSGEVLDILDTQVFDSETEK